LRTPGDAARFARWSPDGRFLITLNGPNARVLDARTGEAMTPLLQHAEEVAVGLMTAGNRLITASYPDLLRAWDFEESQLSAERVMEPAADGRGLNG
jgi:WD40 repeat protein